MENPSWGGIPQKKISNWELTIQSVLGQDTESQVAPMYPLECMWILDKSLKMQMLKPCVNVWMRLSQEVLWLEKRYSSISPNAILKNKCLNS